MITWSRVTPMLIVAAICALLPGCAPPTQAEIPANGGTIIIADSTEPRELNCIRTNERQALRICRLVADPLIDFDRNQNVVARLAESFESSSDGRTLTFHLRKGVRWHDGNPLTASDVLYTVRQIRAPGANVTSSSLSYLAPLDSVEAPDDYTVVSRFKEPYALAYQTWADIFILPEHLAFAPGATSPADRHPIGTGPFRFVRWDPQDKIVLEANDDYFLGRPHVDRLVVRYIPDAHTRAIALKAGEIDLTDLPPSDAGGDDPALPYRLVTFTSRSLEMIVWNTREPKGLFTDARVRRALSMAFDREGYIRHIQRGYGVPAVSPFVPGEPAHDAALRPLPHDPNGAAALLKAAGWRDRDGDGILDTPHGAASFTLLYSNPKDEMERIAALVQSALKPLGIDVRLQNLEWNSFLERVNKSDFEAALKRWTLDPDPDPFDLFHSSQWKSGHNWGGYASSDADRLIEKGQRTLNLAERAGIYHRLEAILRDDQPCTFIDYPTAIAGVSRRIQGLEAGAGGIYSYPDVTRWWLSPASARRGP